MWGTPLGGSDTEDWGSIAKYRVSVNVRTLVRRREAITVTRRRKSRHGDDLICGSDSFELWRNGVVERSSFSVSE
jgi:hypothetical protein